MHPQSELENYKLQVELLQEKLHRSEDNRHELEGKLEQIMKKRNEHERTLRSRSQKKYQQFLDEQKKRNERNRKLVDMLERTDQQAAALSARSERLKMMKLQYELYFSKLVQSYSMKTLQGMPTGPFLPVQRPSSTFASIKTDDINPAEVYPATFNSNTQYQTVTMPVVVPVPNEQNQLRRSWAFATAPQGVLITLTNNSTPPAIDASGNKQPESSLSFDYSQFPIGYLQAPTSAVPLPIHCGVSQSYIQPHQQQTDWKSLFTHKDDIQPSASKPLFEFKDRPDIKRNETISNRTQPSESIQPNFDLSSDENNKKSDTEINEDKTNELDLKNLTKFQVAKMSHIDSSVSQPFQRLKVDKLPDMTMNNSFHHRTQDGRTVQEGNKRNTIDFRTDESDYIKYINEMKEKYEKKRPTAINVAPLEHSIDNITTTLQIQKIDETNVIDDEKINDNEDNEKNTSSATTSGSAFPSLGGKCSIESIGDEALTKKPLENRTEENTSNTPVTNIDPRRDTEQITLFNGTKNSKDESTRASNRSAAIINGGGENTTSLEPIYRPMHFDKKKKMSIENIETAIYGELLTKPPVSLTSADIQVDKLKSVEKGGTTLVRDSSESERYEINNSEKDLYAQEQVPQMGEEQQVELYQVEPEQNFERNEDAIVTENIDDTYDYTDNNVSAGMQEYNMQNYNYANPEQEYRESGIAEELQQQEYPLTEDGQQNQNYPTDYQNYEASQYQTEYDPNAYQYDYEQQQQYNDPNQAQYETDVYNQEYQPDQYTEEYANYEQNPRNEIDLYAEQQYMPEVQETLVAANEDAVPIEKEQMDTVKSVDIPIPEQIAPSIEEPTEDKTAHKAPAPPSILATEKHPDPTTKKKKRVNFIDSETDDSSTIPKPDAVSSESDFDFSAT